MQRSKLTKSLGIILFSVLLNGCDAEKQVVTHVDFKDTVSDDELKQLQTSPRSAQQVINFGFALRSTPQEDARQYIPFLKYLENATGYPFRLQFTSKNEQTIEALGKGELHLAALDASEYLQARAKYPVEILVRGLNQDNKAVYHSSFVVAPKDNISTIQQLRNKRFAFGSKSSTQGHLIPRIVLLRNHIQLSDLKSYEYTGSHYNCANAVIAGKADVCGMQDTMARKMAKQGLIKIIHESHAFPSSGIVIHKKLDVNIKQAIKKALLSFNPKGKHQTDLYKWDSTEMPNGFTMAMESDYQELQNAMQKFGLLSAGGR